MSFLRALKILAHEQALSEECAHSIAAALLDSGVPELEQGALLGLLERDRRALAELAGSLDALAERCFRLVPPTGHVRPVVLASHIGTRGEANLLPLLALTLRRLQVPVLVHGVLSAAGRVVASQVLRELGLLPCVTLGQAQRELDANGIAFVPTGVIAPGLAHLLALRERLGFGRYAERLARFVDPFAGASLLVVASADEDERKLLRVLLRERAGAYLLLDAPHGEPFTDARCRPALELVRDGQCEPLFAVQASVVANAAAFPASSDARATAQRTRSVRCAETPMPLPLVNQLACCLYAAGYAVDINQAKAIAAVHSGSLVVA